MPTVAEFMSINKEKLSRKEKEINQENRIEPRIDYDKARELFGHLSESIKNNQVVEVSLLILFLK